MTDNLDYRRRGEVPADLQGPEQPDYELEADGWKYRSGHRLHTMECATSCAPAERPGPCDCGGVDDPDTVTVKRMTEEEVRAKWPRYAPSEDLWVSGLAILGLIRPTPTIAERIATETGLAVADVERVIAAMKEVG